MVRALLLGLLGAVLVLLSSHVHCSSSSRRQLQQGSTITVPFENLPTLPAISWQQQPQPWQQQQQQQQPPQQQQQPYQQGPGQQSQYQLQQQQQGLGQQGPQQQQPQQQQPQQQQGNSQQGNMDNLAMSSSSQSDMAHAPSIGFGAPTLAASVGLQLPAYLQGAQMSQAFAPAPGPALGPAQGPEGMEFEKLQAAAPSADDEGGEVCLGATKQMVTGECLPFMAQFQLQGPALGRMSDAAFRQAVAIGPTPTDQCCRDAKAFVSGGCSCNAAAAGFAPSIGMTQQELQLSARASVMACPHFSISDPCADA